RGRARAARGQRRARPGRADRAARVRRRAGRRPRVPGADPAAAREQFRQRLRPRDQLAGRRGGPGAEPVPRAQAVERGGWAARRRLDRGHGRFRRLLRGARRRLDLRAARLDHRVDRRAAGGPNASELMDRVGVSVEVVKSAEQKDAGSIFRPLTPSDREMLSGVVMDLYDQFVQVVAEERNLDPATVRQLADGRILSGRQALEYGLVDRIGNLHDALAAAGRMAGLGERPKIIRPPRERITLLDVFLGRATTAALARLVRSIDEWSGPQLKFAVPY